MPYEVPKKYIANAIAVPYVWIMARATIDSSTVRRVAAELDCDIETVRRVFRKREPSAFPISKRIYERLIQLGFLDRKVAADE